MELKDLRLANDPMVEMEMIIRTKKGDPWAEVLVFGGSKVGTIKRAAEKAPDLYILEEVKEDEWGRPVAARLRVHKGCIKLTYKRKVPEEDLLVLKAQQAARRERRLRENK